MAAGVLVEVGNVTEVGVRMGGLIAEGAIVKTKRRVARLESVCYNELATYLRGKEEVQILIGNIVPLINELTGGTSSNLPQLTPKPNMIGK